MAGFGCFWSIPKPMSTNIRVTTGIFEAKVESIYLVVEPTHLKNVFAKMGSSSPWIGVKI